LSFIVKPDFFSFDVDEVACSEGGTKDIELDSAAGMIPVDARLVPVPSE